MNRAHRYRGDENSVIGGRNGSTYVDRYGRGWQHEEDLTETMKMRPWKTEPGDWRPSVVIQLEIGFKSERYGLPD